MPAATPHRARRAREVVYLMRTRCWQGFFITLTGNGLQERLLRQYISRSIFRMHAWNAEGLSKNEDKTGRIGHKMDTYAAAVSP